ncbi:VOC family protein [Woodsholea maritima]|uniref:VOC family protein n=1 Tax=Woodsholea maritima TaxID=240237 RepID=UPI00036DD70E|nr:VOC family protein [Woodsholea maritima]
MRLNQITLPVSDMDRSRAFYSALGCRLIVKTDHYCRFLAPEGDTTLSLSLTDQPLHPGAVIYFECEDVDRVVGALEEAGFHFAYGPRDESWLWREAKLEDPDGHLIKLYHAGINRLDPPWEVGDET